jgi:DNA polymerase-3 subunit delta'
LQQSEYKYLNWHSQVWEQLWSGASGLPHALLLTGPEGIGKGYFALALVARLLCEAPAEASACGQCASCRWLIAGNHPDFRHVIPASDVDAEDSGSDTGKKGSRQILIDQIRDLEDFVFMGGHRNGARVVVIEPAEAMNLSAQNALLKILEEPPSSVYFILVSSLWRKLLPTIRSRCRTMVLPRPSLAEARAWLEGQDRRAVEILPLVDHGPLLAVTESERGRDAILLGILGALAEPGRDPLVLASRWQNQLQVKSEDGLPMESFVRLVQQWLFNLASFKLAGRHRLGESRIGALRQLSERASVSGLIRCYNDLMKFRALASHPLNPQLFLEDIAERYLRALVSDRT